MLGSYLPISLSQEPQDKSIYIYIDIDIKLIIIKSHGPPWKTIGYRWKTMFPLSSTNTGHRIHQVSPPEIAIFLAKAWVSAQWLALRDMVGPKDWSTVGLDYVTCHCLLMCIQCIATILYIIYMYCMGTIFSSATKEQQRRMTCEYISVNRVHQTIARIHFYKSERFALNWKVWPQTGNCWGSGGGKLQSP